MIESTRLEVKLRSRGLWLSIKDLLSRNDQSSDLTLS